MPPHDGHDHPDHDHPTTPVLFLINNITSMSEINDTVGSIGLPVKTEAYIFGTVAVFLVSLLSLVGAVILPFVNNKNIYRGSILLFMSLAVGTMSSDAVLHLIPEVLSAHGHDHEHESEDDHHKHEEKNYIGHMVALLASLYFLFLFESLSTVAAKYCKTLSSLVSDAAHGHSHHGDHDVSTHSHREVSPSLELKSPNKSPSSTPAPGRQQEYYVCGLKPVAFVILMSDGLHNFADGLAIGAAFMAGTSSGFATSVAVVCHELPHEVGDFAIFLNTGMSVKKALVLNFLSALTAFAGLYIGIEVGQLESVRKWIFAVVAGGFLYVALVHMLHEIKEASSTLVWYVALILQNSGLLFGFFVILLLALYEEDIKW